MIGEGTGRDRRLLREWWTDPWFVSSTSGMAAGLAYAIGMRLFPMGLLGMWGWMIAAMIVAGIAGMFLDHMVGMAEAAVSGMVVPMTLMLFPQKSWPWILPVAVGLTAVGMEIIHRRQIGRSGKRRR